MASSDTAANNFRMLALFDSPAPVREALAAQLEGLASECSAADSVDHSIRMDLDSRSLCDRDPAEEHLLAAVSSEDDQTLVGFLHAYLEMPDSKHAGGCWASVPNLLVRPSWRRRGVFAALLESLRGGGWAGAAPPAELEVECCDQSVSGGGCLGALGWRKVRRSRGLTAAVVPVESSPCCSCRLTPPRAAGSWRATRTACSAGRSARRTRPRRPGCRCVTASQLQSLWRIPTAAVSYNTAGRAAARRAGRAGAAGRRGLPAARVLSFDGTRPVTVSGVSIGIKQGGWSVK